MGVRQDNLTSYVHSDEPNLLNLHKALEYDNLGQPVLRVKAAFGGGYGNTAYNNNPATDAFGRLRISDSFTLFDNKFDYQDNDKFSTVTATGGTSVHSLANSSMILSTTTTSGSKVYRETYRVMPYQPGKSLLTLATFSMEEPKANVRMRVGNFSTSNGIFFQSNSAVSSIVLRSNSSGTISDTVVTQANWNVDTLDGSGNASNPSGVELNANKSQIFWNDIEWLGVGTVRTGFVINGQFVICHVFHHANEINGTYMTRASLPIRYEIENIGTTISNTQMHQICSTVMSEGGYQQRTRPRTISRTSSIAANLTSSGTWSPICSLRLRAGHEDAVCLPGKVYVVGDGNSSIYEWALIRNATVGGGLWQVHPQDPNVEFNANATSLSGTYNVENTAMFTSTNQSSPGSAEEVGYNFEQQLGRNQTPTSDTLTLAVRAHVISGGGGNCYGSLQFYNLF
jgi:hypothetical protein